LEFVYPPAALAHPFDDGTALILDRSLDVTAERLGKDGAAYKKLLCAVRRWLGRVSPSIYSRRSEYRGVRLRWRASGLNGNQIRERSCRVEVSGREDAHDVCRSRGAFVSCRSIRWGRRRSGWFSESSRTRRVAGDASADRKALRMRSASYLKELGGEIVTNHRVESLNDLPPARATLCDVTPRQLVRMAVPCCPTVFVDAWNGIVTGRRRFKMDWALSAPVSVEGGGRARRRQQFTSADRLPRYSNQSGTRRTAATPKRPFVLVAQPSRLDATARACGSTYAVGLLSRPETDRRAT
jgi:phytoene dehydrogenase-like protein